jgi:hypothetical protein
MYIYICIIMKHTLPRLFMNGIASIYITATNTLQQLHVTRINFNKYILISKIALKTKTIIVML